MRESAKRRPEARIEVELIDELEEAHESDEEGEASRIEP